MLPRLHSRLLQTRFESRSTSFSILFTTMASSGCSTRLQMLLDLAGHFLKQTPLIRSAQVVRFVGLVREPVTRSLLDCQRVSMSGLHLKFATQVGMVE